MMMVMVVVVVDCINHHHHHHHHLQNPWIAWLSAYIPAYADCWGKHHHHHHHHTLSSTHHIHAWLHWYHTLPAIYLSGAHLSSSSMDCV
jgi:hypothetical protein